VSTTLHVKISRNGEEIGTYEAKEAVRLKLNGTLKKTDDYTHEGMNYGGMTHWAKVSEMRSDLVLGHLFPDSFGKKVLRFVFNLPLCLLGGAIGLVRLFLRLSPVILVPIIFYRWDELSVFLDRPATLGDLLGILFMLIMYYVVWISNPLPECWADVKAYLSPVFTWKLHLSSSEGGPPFGYED
jgi:hypothetical protein